MSDLVTLPQPPRSATLALGGQPSARQALARGSGSRAPVGATARASSCSSSGGPELAGDAVPRSRALARPPADRPHDPIAPRADHLKPRFAVDDCTHTGADGCQRRRCRYHLPRAFDGERCALGVVEKRQGEGLTLREVGEAFGVTRERIRQIEVVALERLCRGVRALVDGPPEESSPLSPDSTTAAPAPTPQSANETRISKPRARVEPLSITAAIR
ncbi:MAG: hypothetical protein IPM35_18305 [Myxococcales bacterium]|nr:hypothetical protein [Myxococcales bacterium]